VSSFRCPEYNFIYDEGLGDDYEGVAPDTRFEALPEDFTCPNCAITYKSDFLIATADD
jgi:rubredoxin